MNTSRTIFTSTLTANLSKAACRGLAASSTANAGLHCSHVFRSMTVPASRQFSTTRRSQLEFFQPPKNLPNIKLTPAAWPHPETTEQQLKSIEVAHREPRSLSDRTAYNTVRFFKWATNVATGYSRNPNKPYSMNARKWLVRFIFLETVAGVPGMVGGMLRHFRSLRSMQRDNGWYVAVLQYSRQDADEATGSKHYWKMPTTSACIS